MQQPQDAFYLSVYRTEETTLGIAVYTAVTLLFAPRTSLMTLRSNMRSLLEGHGALFGMNGVADTDEKMRRMYGQYVSMRDMAETTLQLVPGVRLESYQVYRYRGAWERAIGCSAALLEAQRQWTGTLVALKDLDVPALFPDFDARLGKLGHLFDLMKAAGQEGALAVEPPDVGPLTIDEKAFEALGSTRRSLVLSAQGLFRRQTELARTLLSLSSALLRGDPRRKPRAGPRRGPERSSSPSSTPT